MKGKNGPADFVQKAGGFLCISRLLLFFFVGTSVRFHRDTSVKAEVSPSTTCATVVSEKGETVKTKIRLWVGKGKIRSRWGLVLDLLRSALREILVDKFVSEVDFSTSHLDGERSRGFPSRPCGRSCWAVSPLHPFDHFFGHLVLQPHFDVPVALIVQISVDVLVATARDGNDHKVRGLEVQFVEGGDGVGRL